MDQPPTDPPAPRPQPERHWWSACLLALATVGTGLCVWSYDPADAPSSYVYPPNAVATNWCGPAGAWLADALVGRFGLAAGFVVAGLLWATLRRLRPKGHGVMLLNGAGWVGITVAAAVAFAAVGPRFGLVWPGGWIGGGLAAVLLDRLAEVGAALVLIPLAVACAVSALWPEIGSIAGVAGSTGALAGRVGGGAARRLSGPLAGLRQRRRQRRQEKAGRREQARRERLDAEGARPDRLHKPAASDADSGSPPIVVSDPSAESPPAAAEQREDVRIVRSGLDRPAWTPAPEDFDQPAGLAVRADVALPARELLDEVEPFQYELHEIEIRERAGLLEHTFAQFGMTVEVVQIDTGPVVTQYEIELQPGLRVKKVMALADDLAIAMRAPSVRIVPSIPGRSTVGVEVPNERRAKVGLREMMQLGGDKFEDMRLPLFLGKDVKGHPLIYDLAKMPHLLIAGRTGTGKSVCLNALILSILMTRSPEQVRMLMIDPKMVELSLYADIPHLMHPVVTDMKKAEALLAWAVDKMEQRYELLARCGVRHIDSFNNLSREDALKRYKPESDADAAQLPRSMPFILIFADEMADLMMTSGKEVEAHIIRLAAKSRAVGIHLVLATQKPTVDVITGLIKSNLPARIAFQVASQSDSRVVLDENGADKLLGNGDMLFLYPGTSRVARSQGTFVSDEEVTGVTEFLKAQSGPQYSPELENLDQKGEADGLDSAALAERDELYEDAVEIVVREQRGSVSLLQRTLGVGYGRGAKLIDFMAADGIVGEYNGAQAREVLYTPEQWHARAG